MTDELSAAERRALRLTVIAYELETIGRGGRGQWTMLVHALASPAMRAWLDTHHGWTWSFKVRSPLGGHFVGTAVEVRSTATPLRCLWREFAVLSITLEGRRLTRAP